MREMMMGILLGRISITLMIRRWKADDNANYGDIVSEEVTFASGLEIERNRCQVCRKLKGMMV